MSLELPVQQPSDVSPVDDIEAEVHPYDDIFFYRTSLRALAKARIHGDVEGMKTSADVIRGVEALHPEFAYSIDENVIELGRE
ncbi:MAG TPA: hypothetical protein VL362_02720 [Patescibacteria group bacterium]|jgi:hypothetical protein|nr:hypothetical protein [Patescibacteria group bacterium]